ncbi:DNA-processing protein DprA [Isoptericola jiangsuensis]|uniref:DNA-processing protein DprA n=1 Tax=Isoptericola jiangsuensis TaxID=548579 RepID=UPI003AAC860E
MAEALFTLASTGTPGLRFDGDDPRLAAAAWSRIAEPGDPVAGALVGHLGVVEALAWLVDAARDPSQVPVADLAGVRPASAERLAQAVARWAPRLGSLDPRRELRVLERCEGTLLVPGDERWPDGLAGLGAAAPFALWVRGNADLSTWARRSVALVGARASTAYGERVAANLACGLVDRGFAVVSGGAYGIDAAAHSGALAAEGVTCAVMAGGVDRFYPQGNDDLLRQVLATGTVLSEVPPGSAPFRQRFLARNRLIAALTGATVVVEAAHRSGALSTARHAVQLHRPVGAVPGPVTSMASAGCHALLRDGAAVCVTGAEDVAELAGAMGDDAAAAERSAPVGPRDGLDPDERMLWDALPVRSGATTDSVAASAGLAPRRVMTLLGSFERRGLARRDGARWVRGS